MRYGAKGPPPQPPFPQAYRHVVDGHAHGTVVVDLLGGHALGLVRQEDAQQQEQPLEAIKYPWWGRIKGKRGGSHIGGQAGNGGPPLSAPHGSPLGPLPQPSSYLKSCLEPLPPTITKFLPASPNPQPPTSTPPVPTEPRVHLGGAAVLQLGQDGDVRVRLGLLFGELLGWQGQEGAHGWGSLGCGTPLCPPAAP